MTGIPIRGKAKGSAGAAYTIAVRRGAQRLDFTRDYLIALYQDAETANVNADLMVAQWDLETNSGRSTYWTRDGNPGGLAAFDDGSNWGLTFTPQTAARAQITHMLRYLGAPNVPADWIKLDARWDAVAEAGYVGSVTTTADLGKGRWATDPNYASKLAERYEAYWGPYIPATGDKPVSTTFAPAAVLTYLKDAKRDKEIVVRKDGNVFFYVDADIIATRTTPRFQRASDGAAKIGADLNAGDTAHADFAWIEPDGSLWFYSNWDTRFRGADFRPAGAPIVLPDPEPTPTPEQPVDPSEITAKTYRDVSDPSTLLPPITWRGTTNFFPNRSGQTPVAIVYHCTDDLVFGNTDSWFQNGGSNASSHFVIDRDGKVYQYVSSKDGSWTNGDYNNPRTDLSWLNKAISSGANVNNFTISYEFVATPSTPPTDAQYVSAIALSRYFCHPKVYGINPDRSHQCRHADINSVSRSYCPGPNFDLERIIKALGGDPAKVG